jgi:outer membrane biosynthesis protein TonB
MRETQATGAGEGREALLDSIRRIAAEEAGTSAVLTLTPAMRVAEGRPAPAPRAGDEEPPLVLRNRVDRAGDPERPEEAPPPPPETPEPTPEAPPEPPRESPGEAPPETPPPAPETPPQAPPETRAAAPGPGAAAARAGDAAGPEAARREGPAEVVSVAAARAGGEGGRARDPRAVRQAFAANPGPVAASGLPRNRQEFDAAVTETLRRELAGPLGERISANIRLLVEREVRRALEAERARQASDGDPDGAA